MGDLISRQSLKQKLQEHHDFFINAYGGFSNLPQNDKSRVDEITNCIAMVVNEPSVTIPSVENEGDLISRERLINEWNDLGRRYAMPTSPIHKIAIREFPSADVRENKGEWIIREDNTSFVKQIPRRWVECSHCGWSFSYDRIHDDFCSKCGARMKGGET